MYKDRFTGLYHTHFREYDPVHGRWLSEDPAGYKDGLNLYHMYAGVNWKDPYGLDAYKYISGNWFKGQIESDGVPTMVNGVPMMAVNTFNLSWGRPNLNHIVSTRYRKLSTREIALYTENGSLKHIQERLANLDDENWRITTERMQKAHRQAAKIQQVMAIAYAAPFAINFGIGMLAAESWIVKGGGVLLLTNTADDVQSVFTGKTQFERSLRFYHPDLSEEEIQQRMALRSLSNNLLMLSGGMQHGVNYQNSQNTTRNELMYSAHIYKGVVGVDYSGPNPCYLYQKVGPNGEHLKYGIAKNPLTRYTYKEMGGGKLRLIAVGSKEDMLALERSLHETMPIGIEEGQEFYIQMQVDNGLTAPPY